MALPFHLSHYFQYLCLESLDPVQVLILLRQLVGPATEANFGSSSNFGYY